MASIVRPTANRAVHLRMTPRPSRLGESREVLRLISQFGEVEYYKNLKYDALTAPNTALVIFKSEEAANQCLKRSPIRFRMGKAVAGPDTGEAGQAPKPADASSSSSSPPAQSFDPSPTPSPASGNPGSPFALGQSRSMSTSSTESALPDPPSRPPQMPFQAPPPQLLESRIYQIQSNPARVSFRDQINNGHYHGRFAIDTNNVPQTELIQTVPLAGLSCVDWRKNEKPWRLVLKEKDHERSGPWRRRSLREVYVEGRKSSNKALAD